MIDHTVDYMVKQGWKQVAFMGLEDSYGEGGWVEFKQIATRKGLEIVAAERSRAATPTSRRRRCACRRRNPTRSISTPSRPRPRWQPRRCAASARVRCCMAPARPRRPSWRSARRRSKARWSAPRPCRVSPAARRPSARLGIAAFVQAYDGKYGAGKTDMFAAQAYDTVQIPLLAYRQVVAAGKAADLTQARLAARRHRGDARVSRRQRPVQLQPDRPPGPGPAQHLPGDGQGRQVRTAG